LGAFADQDRARNWWNVLSTELKPMLEFVEPYIELGTKDGIKYYKVQIGLASRDASTEFCGEIKKRKFDCFVIKNEQ
jgi:cell division septation protein DedD